MTRPLSALLDVSDLSVRRGDRTVLSNVTFAAVAGELLCVVGPNGSGKSTLLDACLELVPTQGGEIAYSGRPLERIGHAERPRYAGLVGREESDELGFTVEEILSLARMEGASSVTPPRAAGAAWLSDELRSRKLAHLSQGERQRVHLLRGFLQGASVLFWDEATAHLDLAHREQAFVLAREYAEAGHALVVVVHELELALRHATRLLVLLEGSAVALGTPVECLSRELLREVFGIRAEVTVDEGGLQLRWVR